MRLKRLTVQGYKTFASKQEFIFEEGITAVVGPNGSGKSNIADAVRWVLGEQSYSQLRGKRTTDMIFAGSQSRARAGMAQVVLTFDNSDGWLPIDYTEVEIGRRAYQSGENEYLLNGQKVRLRDVSDLLAKSGLGERKYAIIGQGLIDQALSLRADERRTLFEEAAGITHYKSRRAETLRRLQETQRNLQRVHDILTEIKPRLNSLKRQAARAQNYGHVENDLRQLLREYYGYHWVNKRNLLQKHQQNAHDAEAIWEESRQQLLDYQEQIEAVRKRINSLQIDEREKMRERDVLREKWESIRRQTAVMAERQSLWQQQVGNIEEELPALEQRVQSTQKELETALQELEKAQSRLQEEESELAQFSFSVEGQKKEIHRWQQAIHQLSSQHQHSQQKFSQAKGQLSQLRERLAERAARSVSDGGLAKVTSGLAAAENNVQQARKALSTIRRGRHEKREGRRKLRENLKALRRKQGQDDKQVNRLQKELGRLEARCELLDKMRPFMPASANINPIGLFNQLIDIPPAHQHAIAAALQSRLTTLFLNSEADMWQLVNDHKQSATALIKEHLTAPKRAEMPALSGVIDWARAVVTSKPEATDLANYLLNSVLLVDNAHTAYAAALALPFGYMAVAKDGFVAHAGALISLHPENGENDALAAERAWQEAISQRDEKQVELESWQENAGNIQLELNKHQAMLDSLDVDDQNRALSEQKVQQTVTQAQRQWDHLKQQQKYLQRQENEVAQEREHLEERIAGIELHISSDEENITRLGLEISTAEHQLESLPVIELKQQEINRQQQIEATRTIVAGRQAVVDSRRSTLNQSESQLSRSQKQRSNLLTQLQAIQLDAQQIKQQELQTQVHLLEKDLMPIREGLLDTQKKLREREKGNAGIQRSAHQHENYLTQAKIKLNQQETQLDSLRERIRNDLGIVALEHGAEETAQDPLPMIDIVETLPHVEALTPDIDREIQKYRGQLRRMGAINPDAPLEYEEISKRFEFLSQQVEDLNNTEEQLRKVIAELDSLTSRAFADTVKKVDTVFQEKFRALFAGGSAQLQLTDPDDLTISGVEILAQIPNRRQQGLALLSGGERSLTAAALIFALLTVSPTPFCVMDEVDAMLDEANVTRFVDVLRDLSCKTQFIVITHNRGTVQAAKTVYGISMRADSTSDVISIKPDEYLNQQPLL